MSRLRMVMDQGDPGLFDVVKRIGGAAIRTFVPGGSTALTISGALARRGGGTGALGPSMAPSRNLAGGLLSAPFQLAGPAARLGAQIGVSPGLLSPSAITRTIARTLAPTGGRNIPAGSFRRAGLVPGAARRRRRMNPCNFRALQRGLRRLKAFSKLARMVLKSEGKFKAPRKRGAFGRRKKR